MSKIEYFSRNNTLLADSEGLRPLADSRRINLNWWHIKYDQEEQNFGDMLSPIVFDYLCQYYNLDRNKIVHKTKHLYAIGSILFFENQDITVWGTGSLHDMQCNMDTLLHHRILRKIDVRAVRGPLTRANLTKLKISCPAVYGDPAMLMPLIYKPIKARENYVLVLTHHDQRDGIKEKKSDDVIIRNAITSDWKHMVELIACAKGVVSSSLHGIILAESYGIPAVFLKTNPRQDIFKYQDYYYGTLRKSIPTVNTIEEGIGYDFSRCQMPDVNAIQHQLIDTFPKDLWED